MKIHQVLFFCFLSALQDGNTGLTNAVDLYVGAEGGSGSASCRLTSSGGTTFLCKGECEEKNILIKTDGVTAQSGRYSIRYEKRISGERVVLVAIKQLTKSDSGRYRVGLGRSLAPDDYCDIHLIITDEATMGENTRFIRAQTEGGSVTYPCTATGYGRRKFFCKGECTKKEDILVEVEDNRAQSGRYSIEYTKGSAVGLYVTITHLKKSDSGWYQCGYGTSLFPDSFRKFRIFVVDAEATENPPVTTQNVITSLESFTPPSSFPDTTVKYAADTYISCPDYFWSLVACASVIVLLLAVVLLLVCKLKKRRNSGLNSKETSDSKNKELCVHYEGLEAADTDSHRVYSVLTEAPNK